MSSGAGRRATVRAIASETGLSIATVSRVLNERTNVAPETRERVRQAVQRLGSPAARRRGPSVQPEPGAVLVRCPYLLTDYFGLIVSSVAETLELHGIPMALGAGPSTQETAVLPGLPSRPGIRGAILILPPEPAGDLALLASQGFPFVVVDPRTPPPRDVAAVSAAHAAGARSATAHLVEFGHRRIGFIGGPDEWLASDARRAGHTSALAAAGILPAPELTRSVEPTVELGYRAAGQLLDLPDPPTALVGFNDKIAAGALRAAAERGLEVPADLSVTGFDDIELSTVTQPALTTVRQPLQEMGRMAVALLTRLLNQHEVEALHVELSTGLVVRDSTGPVRDSTARTRRPPSRTAARRRA